MSRSSKVRTLAVAVFAAAPLAVTGAASSAGIAATAFVATAGSPMPFGHEMVHHTFVTPPTTADCETNFGIACYSPVQFQKAYNLGPLYANGWTGKGKTIAIVDSFGTPTGLADLKVYDKAFGLPDPPSYKVIQPAGAVPPFDPTNDDMVGWAQEATLDIEMAHAMAPGANILLVETPVAETEGVHGFPEIVKAENYVIKHHLADVISQSFGASEATFPTAQSLLNLRSAFKAAQQADISVLASSGDSGAADVANISGSRYLLHPETSWPTSDPLVTSIGGLQYFLDAKGHQVKPPAVWNDQALFDSPASGGGGRSEIFARPSYQDGVADETGNHRGVPDISLSAAVDGGVIVYLSGTTNGGTPDGFHIYGGTSEASPMFAGVVAIADQLAGHDLGLLNPAIYRLNAANASGIQDVTHGNNTVSFDQGGSTHTVTGFNAKRGYDLASGVGGIDAAKFVPQLVAASH
jgi:subtilase family serine protease